jgi:hypothetical protein
VRELEQHRDHSTVQTVAWDLETGYQCDKVFQVQHIRHTKRGASKLEDPRDIYEATANQGARRLRECHTRARRRRDELRRDDRRADLREADVPDLLADGAADRVVAQPDRLAGGVDDVEALRAALARGLALGARGLERLPRRDG